MFDSIALVSMARSSFLTSLREAFACDRCVCHRNHAPDTCAERASSRGDARHQQASIPSLVSRRNSALSAAADAMSIVSIGMHRAGRHVRTSGGHARPHHRRTIPTVCPRPLCRVVPASGARGRTPLWTRHTSPRHSLASGYSSAAIRLAEVAPSATAVSYPSTPTVSISRSAKDSADLAGDTRCRSRSRARLSTT